LPSKLPPKILDEELSPSVVQSCTLSFISHKMALSAFRDFKKSMKLDGEGNCF
jgi:hypothetical protein